MTDESWDMMIGEYLGGELDADAVARFEARLAEDPALAARVAGLRAARDAIASGLPSLRQADERAALAAVEPIGAVATRGRRGWALAARYAAVILVGFLAGYWARGFAGDAGGEHVRPAAAMSRANPVTWQERYLAAVRSRPGASDYAHVLLAVARR